MKKLQKFALALPAIVLLVTAGLLASYLHGHSITMFHPAGELARKERNLMLVALLMAVIVVVPVYAMTILIALKYREGNHQKARKQPKYQPDWDHSRLFESIWWGVPIIIIGILSVVAWNSAHALDPYRPLSSQPSLKIQVVSLDWKWLFIYPDQHIASVNQVAIPVGQPVDFDVTSDTIMNSFWVPALGGQIYAMPGMKTQLQAMADKSGIFLGSPANIAGRGFSRMDFMVMAMSHKQFDQWVSIAQAANRNLTTASYLKLAHPSDNVPVSYYSPVQVGLFDNIIMKYMMPDMSLSQPTQQHTAMPEMSNMPGMKM